MAVYIDKRAVVKSEHIGKDTKIWQFAVVLEGARIGRNCNINCHTFIEGGVVIGNNVTVKSGVYLWDGMCVEDDVFLGPNATFVNDRYPRSKRYPSKFSGACIGASASIGANATVLGDVTIGHHALVGAASVVTKDVLPHALVVGNPARQVGWVDRLGRPLIFRGRRTSVGADGLGYALIGRRLVLSK